MPRKQQWIGYGEAMAGMAAVTVVCRLLFVYGILVVQVNLITVAMSYLLAVLITAARRGLGPSIFASVLGVICFDYFFLPPIYIFTFKDPHDWVALTAFLVTANLASRLWAASLAREREALWNREQVLKLYKLSCAIIINLDPATVISSIAQEVLRAFGYRYCGVFQKDENGVICCVSAAPDVAAGSYRPDLEVIETVCRTGNPCSIRTTTPRRMSWWPAPKAAGRSGEVTNHIPSKAGSRVVAVLVMVSEESEIQTMDAIATLVALALERARMLNEIRVKESLKQSDKLKSALLASVSHNLRTPLTSIRASVESILAVEALDGDPMLRELHLIIGEEVNRLSRIVDHLLEMAHVEAGGLHLSREWTSTSEVLDNAVCSCPASVRHHKLLIDCDESGPLIKVDPRMITEVLTNLIDNAAKYSPTGSEITVSAKVEGDIVRFSVADHGPGVAPGESERIFEKFYRGAQPNQRMQEGTGMGLAIARGLVEAHSGRIWVESSPEKGATFVFTLPVEASVPGRTALEMNQP